MLIHQKYESEVVEGDPGSLPGRGVDVDGPGSEAVGTRETDKPWSEILHHTSLPCQFLFLSIHFLRPLSHVTFFYRIG
jgi:hypothetical protein